MELFAFRVARIVTDRATGSLLRLSPIITCIGVIPHAKRAVLVEQEGCRDVICQNPGYATGSAEASDHLRNALAPHSRQSTFEIVQI